MCDDESPDSFTKCGCTDWPDSMRPQASGMNCPGTFAAWEFDICLSRSMRLILEFNQEFVVYPTGGSGVW